MAHRLWRWPNIKLNLPQRLVFDGISNCDVHAPESIIVQAVRVKIERVCALLEEITIFCPDDQ